MIFLILLTLAIVALTIYSKWKYSFWQRHNVPGPKPTWFVGNYGDVFALKSHIAFFANKLYGKYDNVPYVGLYKMFTPVVILRDPELIKNILSTDFNHFAENDFRTSKKYDPLLSENPFVCSGEKWKENRKSLLPAFSSGKMKILFNSMNCVANQMVNYINTFDQNTDFEAKDLSHRFTTQNVMRSGYSVDGGCFRLNEVSELLLASRDLFSGSTFVALKFAFLPIIPQWLLEILPFPFITPHVAAMFERLVQENKASRAAGIKHDDVFQFMIQSKEKNGLDDLFLVAHTMSLYMDGTETSSVALAFLMYQLARNPDVQEKLHKKIVEKLSENDGELTYETLNEFKYLDWVVQEGMRIDVPFMLYTKVCTKDYVLPKVSDNAKPVKINRGTNVLIPANSIHLDSKYFPNPEQFIPERFSDEEVAKRPKFAYIPFGEGPRICIGQRFAVLQVKAAVFMLIKNFKLKLSPNHKPLKFHQTALLRTAKDGILLNFERREQ